MKFRATILQEGKTATGIPVPQEVVDALGAGKRPPVTVSINGHTYRSTVAPYKEANMIALSAENRNAAGVQAGQEVEVEVTLDTAPREVTVPADVAAALDADPAARTFFDGLSYSNKRRHLLSIEDAKSEETRRKRIDKAIDLFRQGKV